MLEPGRASLRPAQQVRHGRPHQPVVAHSPSSSSVVTATRSAARAPLRLRLRQHVASRLRWLLPCAALALAWALLAGRPTRAATLEHALRAHLGARGLLLASDAPCWLEPAQGPLSLRALMFVAHREGELDDVYYALVRAGTRSVHGVHDVTNLTRSSSAAEHGLSRVGSHVAFAVRVGDAVEALEVLDLRGEPAQLTAGWPLFARAQNAITNLQETGRLRGLGSTRYRFGTPPGQAPVRVQQARFVVDAGGAALVLAPGRATPLEGAELVEPIALQKGRPGLITWVVDSVRKLSFVGPAPVEWLEHTVFGVQDRLTRAYHAWFGVDAEVKTEMQQALAAPETPKQAAATQALLEAAGPELGFPPKRLSPVLSDAVGGEGEWRPVVDEAFLLAYPNAPPAFYQTFLRVDPERPYVSVYITLWDPRQIQLHLVMGTKEPESATGETGSGQIPRDPELLKRVVGGFNGGFQAMHGEFGMMAEGRVYLPPKPWAATVAIYADGRTALGSWLGPPKRSWAAETGWDEARVNEQIPAGMIAMRQNLTSVVEDGVYNPWKRWWWGAAPVAAEEQTYIVRTGLCLTAEGHLAYLWGDAMGPEQLGAGMLALGCVRGVHLDMNSKHTGLELYRTFAPGQTPPPLGRALSEHEHEGPIGAAPGFTARARLAVKHMTPLRFPRYLERDPRDFFALFQKPVLPGPDVTVAGERVAFSTEGLPHRGWPHPFARARVGEGVWLLRIDASRAIPSTVAPAELAEPLAVLLGMPRASPAASAAGGLVLRAEQGPIGVRYRLGEAPPVAVADVAVAVPAATGIAVARGADLASSPSATRALGVDGEGFLVYAERAAEGAPGALASALREAGVARAIALPDAAELDLAVGETLVSVDGQR